MNLLKKEQKKQMKQKLYLKIQKRGTITNWKNTIQKNKIQIKEKGKTIQIKKNSKESSNKDSKIETKE